MEAANACLEGKLRSHDDCTFSLLPVLAGVGVEPSIAPLQANLLLGQPVFLEHGDR